MCLVVLEGGNACPCRPLGTGQDCPRAPLGVPLSGEAPGGREVAEQTTSSLSCSTLLPLHLSYSPLFSSLLGVCPAHTVPFACSSFPKLYSGSVSPFPCQPAPSSPARRDALPVKKATSVPPSRWPLCLSCCCCALEGTSGAAAPRPADVGAPQHLGARRRSLFAQESASHLSGLWSWAVVAG